jgi:hypothetical protein
MALPPALESKQADDTPQSFVQVQKSPGGALTFRNFSPQDQEAAYQIAQLKAQGKPAYGYSDQQVQAYNVLHGENPNIREQVNQGTAIALKAQQSGYASTSGGLTEYQQTQGFAGKPSPQPTQQATATPQPSSQQQTQNLYEGPVQQGINEATFRQTGQSVKDTRYEGPIQPGMNEEVFRATGQSVKTPQIGDYQGPIQPGMDTNVFRKTGENNPSESRITLDKTELITSQPFFNTPLGSSIKQGVGELSTSFQDYLSLGGAIGYQENNSPIYPIAQFGKYGSPLYSMPSFSDLSPEQKANLELQNLSLSNEVKLYATSQNSTEDQNNLIKQINLNNQAALQVINAEYKTNVLSASVPSSFLQGIIFGGINAIAPLVALALGGLTLANQGINYQETLQTIKTNPIQLGENIGASLAGGIIGGVGTSLTVGELKSISLANSRTLVPAESIIPGDILSGAKTFPEAPYGSAKTGALRLNLFKSNPSPLPGEEGQVGVYHVSPLTFDKNTVVQKGTSELPGLYTAPVPSIYFAKLNALNEIPISFGFDMTSVLEKSPSINRIYPNDFKLVPGGSLGEARDFLKLNYQQGTAYVLNIKPEAEAGLAPGTPLVQTGSKFYTNVEGRNIPINQYAVGTSQDILNGLTTPLKNLPSYNFEDFKVLQPQEIAYSLSTGQRTQISNSLSLVKPVLQTEYTSSSKTSSSSPVYSQSGFKSLSSVKNISSSSSSSSNSPMPSYSPSISSVKEIISPFKAKQNYTYRKTNPVYPGTPFNYPLSNPSSKKQVSNPKKPFLPLGLSVLGENKKELIGLYKPYYFRGQGSHRRKIYSNDVLPYNAALKDTEKILKLGLQSKGGVQLVGYTQGTPDNQKFTPDKGFRDYRIKHGTKIPLVNQIIELKETRLSSSKERSDIQQARRFKI